MMTKEREKEIRDRIEARAGEYNFDPAFMYKNPYQYVKELLAEIDSIRALVCPKGYHDTIRASAQADILLNFSKSDLEKEISSLHSEKSERNKWITVQGSLISDLKKENELLKDRIGKLREAIQNERDELSRNLRNALTKDEKLNEKLPTL